MTICDSCGEPCRNVVTVVVLSGDRETAPKEEFTKAGDYCSHCQSTVVTVLKNAILSVVKR